MNAVDKPEPIMKGQVNFAPSQKTTTRRHHSSTRAVVSRVIKRGAAYLALILVVLAMVFPLIWMILSSFKSEQEIYHYPPTLLPQHFTLSAYQDLFRLTSFEIWFRNSVVVSIGVTLIALTFSAMGAYALARFNFGFFRVFRG